MLCLTLSLVMFSILFAAYIQALRVRNKPKMEKKNIADGLHEALFNQLYFTGKIHQSESSTSLEEPDSTSCSCGTSLKSISLEVESALHEKYALIPAEYVEEGIETARRMSMERR